MDYGTHDGLYDLKTSIVSSLKGAGTMERQAAEGLGWELLRGSELAERAKGDHRHHQTGIKIQILMTP